MTTKTNNPAVNVVDRDAEGAQCKSCDCVFRPELDLYEVDDHYIIRLDVPGAKSNDISIDVENGFLSLHANVTERRPESAQSMLHEYGVGAYQRRIRLGEDIDVENIEAELNSGVLELTLPKRAEQRARSIRIKTDTTSSNN